jgi:hypothetical protein
MKNNLFKLQKRTIITELFQRFFPAIGPKKPLFKQTPQFHDLTDDDIKNFTNIDPMYTYRNQVYWNPRFYIQKDLSNEFIFQLKKFRKLREWSNTDQLALTQLIITEAIRDTTYEIAYNYQVKSTTLSPFWGQIDILLYNNVKEDDYLPVVPIIFPQAYNFMKVKENFEDYNLSQMVGICAALLTDFQSRELGIDHIKALHTNGSEWILYEVHDNYVKKTRMFESMRKVNKKDSAKIYEDLAHAEVIIGLIRYALSIYY